MGGHERRRQLGRRPELPFGHEGREERAAFGHAQRMEQPRTHLRSSGRRGEHASVKMSGNQWQSVAISGNYTPPPLR